MKVAKLNAHAVLDEKIEKADFTLCYANGLHLSPVEFIAGNAKWLSESFDELCADQDSMKIIYEVLGKGLVRFLLNEQPFAELVKEVKRYDQG